MMYGHEVRDVAGRFVCACVDPDHPIGKIVMEAAHRLPPGTFIDAQAFDYGNQWGACTIYPSGSRIAIRFDPAAPPSAATLATVLAEP